MFKLLAPLVKMLFKKYKKYGQTSHMSSQVKVKKREKKKTIKCPQYKEDI